MIATTPRELGLVIAECAGCETEDEVRECVLRSWIYVPWDQLPRLAGVLAGESFKHAIKEGLSNV